MKLNFIRGKRPLAMMMALALLISATFQCLMPTAYATGSATATYNNLYEFVAEHCYDNAGVATEILKSGALVSTDGITLSYPNATLVSVKEGNLVAQNANSGLNNQKWTPSTYTINGSIKSFNGSTSAALNVTGDFHVEIAYKLNTGIQEEDLNLPATLMDDAITQKSTLDKLTEEKYMDYMFQLDKNTLTLLRFYLVYGNTVLNENPDKNAAIKESFSEIMGNMLDNCYDPTGETNNLKIYNLLLIYQEEGLLYYYRNNEAFREEISVLSDYLTALYGEETRNGVLLTREDKITAMNALLVAAEAQKPGASAYADLIPQLEEKMAIVKANLTAPNENIDLSSSSLEKLVAILETGSTVSPYGSALILTKTVEADLHREATDDDNTGGGESDDNTGNNDSDDDSDDNTDEDYSGGGNTGTDDVTYVQTANSLKNSLNNADNGDTICIASTIAMTEDITVSKTINITGAKRLDDTNHILTLSNTTASITADAPLNVASGVDGYVPVKSESGYKYTLAEVQHPEIGGKTAGSKTETLNSTRYLYLDLDPTNGMTLNAFRTSTAFDQLDGHTVSIAIKGNDGSALIKTADRMTVTARNSDGKTVAQITYVIIVMGDSNCNGKVNSSDAAVTKSISMGNQSSLEARMAADVNFSGTLETPKINSSDVSYIMAKWFAWDLNKYVSNLK